MTRLAFMPRVTAPIRRLGRAPAFLRGLLSMARLAWQAEPRSFGLLILLQLLEAAIPIGSAWLAKLLFDQVAQAIVAGTATGLPSRLIPLLAAQVTLTVIGQQIQPLASYCNGELSRQLTLRVQATVYQKINSLAGLASFEDPAFHDTVQLGVQGAQMGPSQALSILTSLLSSLVSIGGFLGILLAFNPLLAGLVGLAMLPQLVAQFKLGRQRFDLAFENSPKLRQASYYGMLLSSPPFAKELRLFGLADHFLAMFVRRHEQVYASQRAQQRRELRWESLLALLGSLVGGAAFVAVVVSAAGGRLTLGDVTLYLGAVAALQIALGMLVMALGNLNECLLFHAHYQKLLALRDPLAQLGPPRPVPPLRHAIELRDVSFRYGPGHPWVLRKVNLCLPAGQSLALVGLNGTGKTTLVKLLTRCYDPSEGQILWDGIDIRHFAPAEFRRRLGAIFQDFARYELSAYDNIALGDVERYGEQEAVRAAARTAGVDRALAALPSGYQTMLSRWLSEDGQGVDLSGGQWQKLATARMFMRQEAELLILDEPTAALDAEAEYELYQRFVELVAGRTTLLISHRLSTVRMASQIAVLADGAVSELGSHEELLTADGRYAALYRMQASQYMV
jgi:ATP-binding cassette subfamily B protein